MIEFILDCLGLGPKKRSVFYRPFDVPFFEQPKTKQQEIKEFEDYWGEAEKEQASFYDTRIRGKWQ